jgi:hypothetical protein
VLWLFAWLLHAWALPARADEHCLSFVGDVSLSRAVADALDRTAAQPWQLVAAALRAQRSPAAATPRASEPWVGNLEGTLLPSPTDATRCQNLAGICLGILPRHLRALAGSPFVALSLENNHSQDFGQGATLATRSQLAAQGIAALTDAGDGEDGAFQIVQTGDVRWALVAINLINRSRGEIDQALLRARLRIGLARASTPWVVVLPHWGREYDAQAGPGEWSLSALFVRWGARLVVGSHPHVIGDHRCIADAATYYSLGNFLFDQRQEITHRGLLLRCCARGSDRLRCRAYETERSPQSPWPRLGPPRPQQDCTLDLRASADGTAPPAAGSPPDRRAAEHQSVDGAWQRHPHRASLRYVQSFRSLGPQHFFALRRQFSSFDGELALRPYVFALRDGRFVDLFRGTALSWPTLYARLVQLPDGRERLCALHRGDSFIRPNPQIAPEQRFHAVYAWSGFGFRRVDDTEALALCQTY